MEKRGFVLDDEVLQLHQHVVFTGASSVDYSRPLVIKYPGAFPSMPPRIFSETPGRLLRRHQRPGTWEICLFGPGQRRWSAELSGSVAIDEAEEIIRLFSDKAEVVEDEVPEPASALYHYAVDSAIFVPPEVATPDIVAADVPLIGTFRLRFRRSTSNHSKGSIKGRGIILSAKLGEWHGQVGAAFSNWCSGGQEEKGPLVWLPKPLPFLEGPKDFSTWLDQHNLKTKQWIAFVFPEQSGTVLGQRFGWLVVQAPTSGTFHYIRAFPYRSEERVARIPGLGGLAGKKVVFVGCGSMGSKIAVALASSGINRFGLVDFDMFKPENSVRHEVGVCCYGDPKVLALAKRLYEMNPMINVDKLCMRIGDLDFSADENILFDLLAAADLVIETTGSHGVSRWVNDMCHDFGVPSVYATVTNGAWGGEIVRVIPGRTACWQCWYAEWETDRPPGAPAPKVGIFAPGCEQPTFTGATYEIGVVANLAAWVAVETLLRDESGRKDFRGDYVRWVARTSEGVPDLAPAVLEIHKRPGCPVCNPL